ncbi:MAG: cobalt-precorrin-4 C(11)-methyltransferase, partial [Desulfobacula sp.]|nr:cobalt-precorrin-4 C(11)-methyltransferase [Desulfobacula sp.]
MKKDKSRVIFAGAGPGDPELITVKAQNALKTADLIIY